VISTGVDLLEIREKWSELAQITKCLVDTFGQEDIVDTLMLREK
jgi:hypothetical protein